MIRNVEDGRLIHLRGFCDVAGPRALQRRADTQTVGIWSESLREMVRHKGALHGGQRFVQPGYVFNGPGLVGPQDGIEPMRRIVKWIISEEPLPGRISFWEAMADEIKVIA